jgi:sugar phosphate isomerase/epimerase
VQAGYAGIGIRLFRSPGITYAFHPVTGDPTLMRQIKQAISSAGLEVLDVLSFYLQPDMDLDSMLPPLAFGAEIGARYALVIGDDPDWQRMCDNFGRFCDAAAAVGLTAALEAPVNSRAVNTLPLALQLIADTGGDNAVICLDPLQYFRAGHSVRAQCYWRRLGAAARHAGCPTSRCAAQSGVAGPRRVVIRRCRMGQDGARTYASLPAAL